MLTDRCDVLECGVDLSRDGADRSFEAMMRRCELDDPVFRRIAATVSETDPPALTGLLPDDVRDDRRRAMTLMRGSA